jgi:hypothetical protein
MEQTTLRNKANTSYKEVKIGNTLYRVTSVFSGEKDLGHTLEQLAVRRAMTELTPPRILCFLTIKFSRPAASLRGESSRVILMMSESHKTARGMMLR